MKFVVVALAIIGIYYADTADEMPLPLDRLQLPKSMDPAIIQSLCDLLEKLTEMFNTSDVIDLDRQIMDRWGSHGDCMNLDQFTDMWNELGMSGDQAAAFKAYDINEGGCIDWSESEEVGKTELMNQCSFSFP